MSKKKDKYITLKEAAEISGYAPDYIGQLIRGGKLDGKQVFSNVAWVTTFKGVGKKVVNRRLYKALLGVLIGIGVLFALFLFYILSINLEDYLERRAIEKAVERASTIQPQDIPDVPQLPL